MNGAAVEAMGAVDTGIFQGSENMLGCNGHGRNVEGIIVFRRFLDLSDGKIDRASKDFK